MPTHFYTLTIQEVRTETPDCVSIVLQIPEELKEKFKFKSGQYLTFKKVVDGEELRRSYSICSSPNDHELRVAIKKVVGGKFSTFANENLKTNDTIDVMPPMGNFSRFETDNIAKKYLAIAAGSGITPLMSIIKDALETHVNNEFTLIYGNQNRQNIIFRESIEALKNTYMERFRVYYVLSKERMDVELLNGRINAEKCALFCQKLINAKEINEAFICGPEEMILATKAQLIIEGIIEKNIHIELFTSSTQVQKQHEKWNEEHAIDPSLKSKVSIRLDGTTFDLDLAYGGDNILDAALNAGADLPYACKGGVCCTCRAKVIEGSVEMEVNYALSNEEVAKGYVLTCQSHPTSERVMIDFDAP